MSRLGEDFDRAQHQYDNQSPPEDDLIDCIDCDGDGKVLDDGAPDAIPITCKTCKTCKGKGELPKPKMSQEDFDNNDRMGDG